MAEIIALLLNQEHKKYEFTQPGQQFGLKYWLKLGSIIHHTLSLFLSSPPAILFPSREE